MRTIVGAEDFPEAKKPAYKLSLDFGDLGIKRSSAQITALYKKEDLIGKQVIAVVNFPPKQIGPFISECLRCIPEKIIPLESKKNLRGYEKKKRIYARRAPIHPCDAG